MPLTVYLFSQERGERRRRRRLLRTAEGGLAIHNKREEDMAFPPRDRNFCGESGMGKRRRNFFPLLSPFHFFLYSLGKKGKLVALGHIYHFFRPSFLACNFSSIFSFPRSMPLSPPKSLFASCSSSFFAGVTRLKTASGARTKKTTRNGGVLNSSHKLSCPLSLPLLLHLDSEKWESIETKTYK